jgi:hypothetical protein
LFGLLEKEANDAQEFRTDVKSMLEKMDVRRKERAATTAHGLDFQDYVYQAIQAEAQRLGDVPSFVGNTPGCIPPRCIIGDVIVELGPESSAPSAKVVAEAKEDKSYKLSTARAEIEKARENRKAAAGLFVFSSKIAPDGMEPLHRIGQDVFVVWDHEDAASDVCLKLGLSVARALCIHEATKKEGEAADISEMEIAIAEVKRQVNELDEIRKCAKNINKNTDTIIKRLKTSSDAIHKHADTLAQRLQGLKQAAAVD